jgi:hypothetical protein
MRTWTCVAILAVSISFGLLNSSARAQTAPVSGTIVSASVDTPRVGYATVYSTPSSGNFVLTQFCAGVNLDTTTGSGITLDDLQTGNPIAFLAAGKCESFEPGYAIPPSHNLICRSRQGPAAFCSISGVLE